MKVFMRIVVFSMFFFLIIALILALVGIDKINFDNTYYKFFSSVAYDYEGWKLEIPRIPSIPHLYADHEWYEVLNVLIDFVNGFFAFLNVIIMIVNYIVKLIQFLSTLIYDLFVQLPQILKDNGYHPIL